MPTGMSRRKFLVSSAAGLAGASLLAAPGLSRTSSRPAITHGLQSGDVDTTSGMIWARTDRPSQMLVEVSTRESFRDAIRLPPIDALPESDYAAKQLLESLPPSQDIFYRVAFVDLSDINAVSEPLVGRFRTAPAEPRSVRLVWSGDTAGQGWGIDSASGGMKTYATMLRHTPDFFIHSGDTVYCDDPVPAEKTLQDGSFWRNFVTEEVGKVAETLAEFRGRFKYNLLDENLRAFNAVTPTFFQWDDHEVVNNRSSARDLSSDDRYTEKSLRLLTARAGRAFHEMTPIRYTPAEPGRVYRKIAYGPLLDVFFIDLRSYRGANGLNLETELTPESRILGEAQARWLKHALAESRATWKIVASDKPIGLIDWSDGGARTFEGISNAEDGTPKGRELELADLLASMKRDGVQNVVWLTAEVHYTAAHHYDPSRAAFQDFDPFWEFVSGPLHAGTFGPAQLDRTFGPEVRFQKAPTADQPQNLPPSAGLQFFGIVEIDGATEAMTVRLMDRDDNELFVQVLEPQGVA